MKHVLSLVAIIAFSFLATTAHAVVRVQLNLQYNDPANETAGGTWDLLVQSDTNNGLAGVRVVLDGLTGVTGIDTGNIVWNSSVFDPNDSVARYQPFGSGVELPAVP